MGCLPMPAYAIGFILLLFFASIGHAVGGGADQTSSDVGTSSNNHEGLTIEKLAVFVTLQESLNKRSEHFHERLQGIEQKVEAAAKKKGKKLNAIGQLYDADFYLLAMGRSRELLRRAVALQRALDGHDVGDEDDAKKVGKEKAVEALNVFKQAIEALWPAEGDRMGKSQAVVNAIKVLINEADNLKRKAMERMGNYKHKKDYVGFGIEYRHSKREPKITTQADVDASVQKLAQLVIREQQNPFVQLEMAMQVLDQAAILRQAMAALVVAKKEQQGEEEDAEKPEMEKLTESTVRAYNEFARKLELLVDHSGLHRNLCGKFRLDEIGRKIEEETEFKGTAPKKTGNAIYKLFPVKFGKKSEDLRVVDAEFWKPVHQLLQHYYQLALPQMGVVKIRQNRNGLLTICIGLIEYWYDLKKLLRYKFREDLLDEYTSPGSMAKATPLAQTAGQLVSVAEADRIFFEMVEQGWTSQNYNMESVERLAVKFAWHFLCRLFDKGGCPKKENMPANIVAFVEKEYPSAFSARPEHLLPHESHHPKRDPYKCVLRLQHYEVQLEFDGSGFPDGKPIPMPPIVRYTAGKWRGIVDKLIRMDDKFTIEEQTEEYFPTGGNALEAAEGSSSKSAAAATSAVATSAAGQGVEEGQAKKKRYFKARLSAYECAKEGQPFAQIQDVRIYSQWGQILEIEAPIGVVSGHISLESVDLNKVNHFHVKAFP